DWLPRGPSLPPDARTRIVEPTGSVPSKPHVVCCPDPLTLLALPTLRQLQPEQSATCSWMVYVPPVSVNWTTAARQPQPPSLHCLFSPLLTMRMDGLRGSAAIDADEGPASPPGPALFTPRTRNW